MYRYLKFSIAGDELAAFERLKKPGESDTIAAGRLFRACLALTPEKDEVRELKDRIAALETAIANLQASKASDN